MLDHCRAGNQQAAQGEVRASEQRYFKAAGILTSIRGRNTAQRKRLRRRIALSRSCAGCFDANPAKNPGIGTAFMKLAVRLQAIRRLDNAGRAVQRQTDLPAPLRQTKAGRQNAPAPEQESIGANGKFKAWLAHSVTL